MTIQVLKRVEVEQLRIEQRNDVIKLFGVCRPSSCCAQLVVVKALFLAIKEMSGHHLPKTITDRNVCILEHTEQLTEEVAQSVHRSRPHHLRVKRCALKQREECLLVGIGMNISVFL